MFMKWTFTLDTRPAKCEKCKKGCSLPSSIEDEEVKCILTLYANRAFSKIMEKNKQTRKKSHAERLKSPLKSPLTQISPLFSWSGLIADFNFTTRIWIEPSVKKKDSKILYLTLSIWLFERLMFKKTQGQQNRIQKWFPLSAPQEVT